MAGRAELLRLRLFLEGVEVPVVGAQISALPNSPVMAAIQVPPIAEGTRLLPRTLVHLFTLDFYESDSVAIARRHMTTTDAEDPSAYQQALRRRAERAPSDNSRQDFAQETANEHYKLLFGGEILGFEWTKNEGKRCLVLQCADWSNYWDYAYQWSNTGLFGPGLKALFAGGSTNLFTDFLRSNGEVVANLLRTPSTTFPALGGLAGGLLHLIERIGGSYSHERKIAGQNIFFTLAELRLRITQMVSAVENDPTASRLLGSHGYDGLFGRILGGLGNQASIRQCLNALQGVIFHEMYAQPCPRFEPGTRGTVSGSEERKLRDDPKMRFIAFNADLVRQNLEDVLRELSGGTEPTANASEASQLDVGALRSGLVLRLQRMRQILQGTSAKLRKLKVPTAGALLASATQKIATAAAAIQTSSDPREPKTERRVTQDLTEAIERLRRVSSLSVSITPRAERRPARLHQQIFRPDVWFSAPPRCNVVFPEQYNHLHYRRQFLEEPTRLLLKTNDEFFGEDELFDRYYFAPRTRSVKTDKARFRNLLENDLLEHEILTGILPVFEKMGELNIFAARGAVTDGNAQVGLAQRSANFIYYKYRFAARQMQVRGRFNPFVAVGFPGVIIDKYVDARTLERHNELLAKVGRPTRDITQLLGTNFLGNFTQVTHTVSQDQGSTEILCTYPRQPEESIELLGVTDREDPADLPAEEYIRPGWYGDVWHPSKISQAYESFFGTTAITDTHEVNDAASIPNAATEEDPLGLADGPARFLMPEGASIEQAVTFLVVVYSHVRQQGLDVEEFIRSYTWRPIASMVDMFGTTDLVLSRDGLEVLSGVEGFHSRAFGPFSDLFGLVSPEIEELVGLRRGSNAALRGDTRKQKQDAVKDFVQALTFAHAVLG